MKHILLIYDDLKHLADLAVMLIEAGYQFIPTADLESDIEFIHRPELVTFSYFLYG